MTHIANFERNICVTYAPYPVTSANSSVTFAWHMRRTPSHQRIRRKCCAHLPHEECTARDVTFGSLCKYLLVSKPAWEVSTSSALSTKTAPKWFVPNLDIYIASQQSRAIPYTSSLVPMRFTPINIKNHSNFECYTWTIVFIIASNLSHHHSNCANLQQLRLCSALLLTSTVYLARPIAQYGIARGPAASEWWRGAPLGCATRTGQTSDQIPLICQSYPDKSMTSDCKKRWWWRRRRRRQLKKKKKKKKKIVMW
jgi:hypothetical protein